MDLCAGRKKGQYSVVPDNEHASPSRSWTPFSGPFKPTKGTQITLLILLVSIFSGLSGYVAGKRSAPGEGGNLVQLDDVPVTFEFEFNFAEAPSNITNQRWESLFPSNAGFFEHPAAGDGPVTFSVFHQLHCLDGIRHAYWKATNGNPSEEHSHHSEEEHSEHSEHSSEAHVRHCLEYIRQGIMCAADTTVEQGVSAGEGRAGVAGFGTEHVCRNFQQLIEWTSVWE
ncbi:hypothetical protein F5Y18DRAFT_202299 [Xylariaceae sp. FL1019]|nr:hypothetical protein F5Y18DRAFT_202299 [Xylariaceae sp. FL1019]